VVNARDAVGFVGLSLTAAGAWWVFPPAGLIVPGVILMAVAIIWRRG
jgi:hypothetical protein